MKSKHGVYSQQGGKKKKPHYKKKQSGIYNKKSWNGKDKNKNRTIDSMIEELVVQAQQAQYATEALDAKAQAALDAAVDQNAENAAASANAAQALPTSPKEKRPVTRGVRMLMQTAMAGAFVCMGLILLLSTMYLVYYPMRTQNEALAEQRLETRMELSLLIADVFPSMKVEDELSDLLLRAMENRKNTLRTEGNAAVKEVEALRNDSEIQQLLTEVGLTSADVHAVVQNNEQTKGFLDTLSVPIGVLDARIAELGVAELKEKIAELKGTTTTVTREDENGQTVTETVVTGGLIPEQQKQKDALQKKYDEIKTKLDQLEAYISENQGRFAAMYNRLEDAPKVDNIYTKLEAITAYVKQNPKDNIFMKDTEEKLQSFPGESKEEDDILFIMKVESETGIRLQTVNYGQDYQHKRLSNGMLLCYEVYSIPYYATYPGLKNLIAYFNDNDDFYASVYTLSMQYNPANESIQGVMVILHYYLLEEGAEYVPPVIDEVIIPGIDGIFGEVTQNGALSGPQSDYTPEQIEEMLQSGMTLEEVRDKLKSEGYPATELAWILKKKYKTQSEIQGFIDQYSQGKQYGITELEALFECDIATLYQIYNAQLPEDSTGEQTPPEPEEDTTDQESPEVPEDTTGTEDTPAPESGKQSDYTAEDVERWMSEEGMSLADVRDKLKAEDYSAMELAWILHEEYQTESAILEFMLEKQEFEYLTLEAATALFECSLEDLKEIYRS